MKVYMASYTEYKGWLLLSACLCTSLYARVQYNLKYNYHVEN